MTPNKNQLKTTLTNFGYFICLFISSNLLISDKLPAQESYKLNEIEVDRSMNLEEEDDFNFTNPFEIVDRIRRANSMNDATKPSDAVDDAIKSFDMIREEK